MLSKMYDIKQLSKTCINLDRKYGQNFIFVSHIILYICVCIDNPPKASIIVVNITL